MCKIKRMFFISSFYYLFTFINLHLSQIIPTIRWKDYKHNKLIIITTYSQLNTNTKNNHYYYKITWGIVLLDECHKIHNLSTQIFNHIIKLKAEYRIALSGINLSLFLSLSLCLLIITFSFSTSLFHSKFNSVLSRSLTLVKQM